MTSINEITKDVNKRAKEYGSERGKTNIWTRVEILWEIVKNDIQDLRFQCEKIASSVE